MHHGGLTGCGCGGIDPPQVLLAMQPQIVLLLAAAALPSPPPPLLPVPSVSPTEGSDEKRQLQLQRERKERFDDACASLQLSAAHAETMVLELVPVVAEMQKFM
jgi:hypothetical protein